MPSGAVYLVLPSAMALTAAALIWSGVSKSGSPAASAITSRPAAFNSAALVDIAMVGEGFTRSSAVDKMDMTASLCVCSYNSR